MPYALASEYDWLSPEQKAICTHIIADDGCWSKEQIEEYVANYIHYPIEPDSKNYES